MEYKIVWAVNLSDLESLVRRQIEEGWTPQGGIAMTPRTSNEAYACYAQAMTRPQPAWNHTDTSISGSSASVVNLIESATKAGWIDRTPVVSSMLKSVGYDTIDGVGILEVEFRNGETYRYSGVPEYHYQSLLDLNAENKSVGRYFINNIKMDYRVERVNN